MGNTRIQDANTGHIMGLREGFIPIGMKEHGGVIYIASVNKKGEGEIGTIPSPIIRDFLKESTTMKIDPTAITTADKGTGNDYVRISNKFYPGEKFLMALDLRNGYQGQFQPGDDAVTHQERQKCCRKSNETLNKCTVDYPLIQHDSVTYAGDYSAIHSNKGVYKIVLFSQSPSGIFRAGDRLMLPQTYYGKDGTVKSYPQWFMDYTEDTTLNPDLRLMNRGDGLKSYPSTSLPGYLCIKAELNSKEITKFEILKRSSGGLKVPGTVKVYSSNKDYKFYTYFPGFWYETNSFSYINKMEISVYNESSGEYLDLVKTSNDTDQYGHMLLVAPSKKITINIDNDANGGIAEKPTKLLYVKTTNKDDKFVYNGEYYFEPTPVYNYIILPDKKEEIKADPRTFCITNRGDFVNTWITDGFTYLKGQSVVTSNVVSNAPAFYGGLFHIDFGQNCNQWCKLEITFYNQYDDQIGVYTCKFNPYLNDTFGTNDIPEVELAPFVSMNKSTTIKGTNGQSTFGAVLCGVNNAKDTNLKYNNSEKAWKLGDVKKMTFGYVSMNDTINLDNLTLGNVHTAQITIKNRLYTQYEGQNVGNFTYCIDLKRLYLCSQAKESASKWVAGEYTTNVTSIIGRNGVFGSDQDEYNNYQDLAMKYEVGFNTETREYYQALLDYYYPDEALSYGISAEITQESKRKYFKEGFPNVNIFDRVGKGSNDVHIYGSNPGDDQAEGFLCNYGSYADFDTDTIATKQKSFTLTQDSVAANTENQYKSVFGSSAPLKVKYSGNILVYYDGKWNAGDILKWIKFKQKSAPCCLPFFVHASLQTRVLYEIRDGTYKSTKKILPYVKHRMNFEDTGEVKDVGKLYTSEENWRKATNINWKREANLKRVDYTGSNRITSWKEMLYKQKDPNDPISFTLSPKSIYVINFSGKCLNPFFFTYKGNSIYASKFVSSKSNYYFCPIVIVTGIESTTIDFTNETNAYITDYACGKVIDDSNSRYYQSLTSDGGPTITEGWYRLDYFNSLICQYNAELTEQKTEDSTQTTSSEKKPIDPIILPLASCYRESYFSNNSGESAFYMNDITFQDTHTKYAIYFPPAEYMCYTFDKYQGLDNTGDNQTQTDWYYQANVTSLNQNSSNINQLENATIRVVPGSSLKVSATNTSIFGNSNNLFNRIWQ